MAWLQGKEQGPFSSAMLRKWLFAMRNRPEKAAAMAQFAGSQCFMRGPGGQEVPGGTVAALTQQG